MVLPVGEHRAQQLRAAQQRAVERRDPTERHVAAAAGAEMAAGHVELLAGEPELLGVGG